MNSTKRSYFDRMYADEPDPWGFETSAYEQRKYAITLASLPRPRYRAAFEPGCSVGVLTELLAPRCDVLVATDLVPATVTRAAERLARYAHVVLECGAIPENWPEGSFDLIVLSEVAYYFDRTDLARLIGRVLDSTREGAHVVGVHWRGVTDYPLSGDVTHEIIDAAPQLVRTVHHLETEFVLDVWERQA